MHRCEVSNRTDRSGLTLQNDTGTILPIDAMDYWCVPAGSKAQTHLGHATNGDHTDGKVQQHQAQRQGGCSLQVIEVTMTNKQKVVSSWQQF